AFGAGCAGAGASRRGLGVIARVPRFTLGARDTVLAVGAGVGLSTRSDADTTSTRFAELPASCTLEPPAFARSCSRSELTVAWSGEPEHAAAAATSTAPSESRRKFVMVVTTPR